MHAIQKLPHPLSLRLELGLNRALDALGLGGAGPAALHLTILADEELLKVPLDALHAQETRLLLLHPLPHGLGLVAIDLGLAEHLVGDLVAEHAEVLDLLVGARVLAAELVAGEGEDFEVGGVGGFDVWWGRVLVLWSFSLFFRLGVVMGVEWMLVFLFISLS
jgi:hypothetical protein